MKKRKLNFKLSAEEKKIESEIAKGNWIRAPYNEVKRLRSEMRDAIQNQNKDARVNLRLNPKDVGRIREKAEREGIPYQTLMGSVLHKYATDQFLDEKTVREVVKKFGKKIAS